MIISDGYNGTPSGFENCCDQEGLTKWDVLHAEANAILKVARVMRRSHAVHYFVTMQECSKLIHQSGIKEVYHNGYRDDSGIQF
jgi:dCMP deaminase